MRFPGIEVTLRDNNAALLERRGEHYKAARMREDNF